MQDTGHSACVPPSAARIDDDSDFALWGVCVSTIAWIRSREGEGGFCSGGRWLFGFRREVEHDMILGWDMARWGVEGKSCDIKTAENI